MIIPTPGRMAVLAELHEGHPGIARMKGLACMHVWWPGITADIEEAVPECTECQMNQSTPPAAPLHPWSRPTRLWERLHLDYAGPVEGRMFLILIDAHSKWIEAFCTSTSMLKAVRGELRTTFARFGSPETIMMDNVTCIDMMNSKHFLVATN